MSEPNTPTPPPQAYQQNADPNSLGQFAYGSPEWQEAERRALPYGRPVVIPLPIPMWFV